jgi:hypothetical protein
MSFFDLNQLIAFLAGNQIESPILKDMFWLKYNQEIEMKSIMLYFSF